MVDTDSRIARPAPLITLVSASGGVGKSTLALLMAHLAAKHSIKTCLIEGDLQFGDMGFWLGLDTSLPSLALGETCSPITISNRLSLYKAPTLPEIAEDVSDAIVRSVPQILTKYDLAIADTGQFWSGLTGALLCLSDLVCIVMDHRRASVYGAIKALELCRRLGVPIARTLCIINRASGLPKGEVGHIQDSLDGAELVRISDGKGMVEAMVSSCRIEELVEGSSPAIFDLEDMMANALPRIGVEFAASSRKRTRGLFS